MTGVWPDDASRRRALATRRGGRGRSEEDTEEGDARRVADEATAELSNGWWADGAGRLQRRGTCARWRRGNAGAHGAQETDRAGMAVLRAG